MIVYGWLAHYVMATTVVKYIVGLMLLLVSSY